LHVFGDFAADVFYDESFIGGKDSE
jgi:hypothetical protein